MLDPASEVGSEIEDEKHCVRKSVTELEAEHELGESTLGVRSRAACSSATSISRLARTSPRCSRGFLTAAPGAHWG